MSGGRWIVAIVAALSVGTACSSDKPASPATQAGTLTMRLTTPNADDGAMLFEVGGPPIDTALAGNGSLRLFTRRADGSKVVGAIIGALTNGTVVTLHVPNVGATGYTARVIEVADRQNALRASLAGYALTVAP